MHRSCVVAVEVVACWAIGGRLPCSHRDRRRDSTRANVVVVVVESDVAVEDAVVVDDDDDADEADDDCVAVAEAERPETSLCYRCRLRLDPWTSLP